MRLTKVSSRRASWSCMTLAPPAGRPPCPLTTDRDAQAAALTARLKRIDAAQNTQIYEGTNQIQRMVMARQLLK
jgi:hypothetical protein